MSLKRLLDDVRIELECTMNTGFKRHSYVVNDKIRDTDEYYDSHLLTPKGSITGTDIALWESTSPWIEVTLVSPYGEELAIDYQMCVIVYDGEGGAAIIVSSEFKKLFSGYRQILLYREILRYALVVEATEYEDFSVGSTVKLENDDNEIMFTDADTEFRIMSWLYCIFGEKSVNDAIKYSTRPGYVDKYAITQYKRTHGVRGLITGLSKGFQTSDIQHTEATI